MSILQELLNLGLVDIGSDDSRFEKMLSASSALSTKFKEDPGLLIPATLISLDEGVDEDDPMFSLVEALLVAEWKTLRNTHVNRPRELLRSIMIDALETAVNRDHGYAAIVWNSAASPVRHQQVRLGKASSEIGKLLISAGELAEKEAVARAGMVAAAPKKRGRTHAASPEKQVLKISAAIEDADVFVDVARSAGPQHPLTPNLDNPNPHWPNQGQPWATEFATRMAAALSKAVSLGNARVSEALTQQLAAYLGEFEKQLMDQFRDAEQLQRNASRMRLDVLWWSEALYSRTLNTGYRELKLPVAAVAAAVDLSGIVPPLAPASVCYVLDETLLRVSQFKPETGDMSVQSFLDGIADARTEFGERLPGSTTSNARLPLVDLVGQATAGSRISAEALRGRAGVDASLVLTPGEFAMWVLRGIQANRLVEALR